MNKRDAKWEAWLTGARQRYVAAHAVDSAPCRACGRMLEPVERVNRLSQTLPGGRKVKVIGVSDRCDACRASGALAVRRPWTDFDYTAWAEALLYPGTPYLAMTQDQRLHCYWLARLRWAVDGWHLMMPGITDARAPQVTETERERLRNWRMTLARKGRAVDFPPYTDWLDGDHYADDCGRSADAAESGRNDVDADRHAAGAEAA